MDISRSLLSHVVVQNFASAQIPNIRAAWMRLIFAVAERFTKNLHIYVCVCVCVCVFGHVRLIFLQIIRKLVEKQNLRSYGLFCIMVVWGWI